MVDILLLGTLARCAVLEKRLFPKCIQEKDLVERKRLLDMQLFVQTVGLYHFTQPTSMTYYYFLKER